VPKKNGYLLNAIIVTFSIIFGIIGAEFLFQGYSRVRTGNKFNLSDRDNLLGWTASKNANVIMHGTTKGGVAYKINYQTDNNGFRTIEEDLTNSRKKIITILVIGDSFTGGAYASNNDMWYAKLQQNLPVRVLAHGQSGYGTFQEYLLFKRLSKEIKPDILLIQFCPNDVSNDYLEYSNYSIVRGQDLIRPYFKNGKAVFNEKPTAHIYRFLHKNSSIFRRLDLWLENVQYQKYGYSKLPQEMEHEFQIKAANNWSYIYQMFVNEAKALGVQKVWSISCNPNPSNPMNIIWLQKSNQLGVKTFLGPANSVKLAEMAEIDVRHSDGGHWNHTGNKIAGDSLVDEILTNNLLDNLHPGK